MKNSSVINSSVLEVHTRLVRLISEESEILEKTTSPDRIKRHTQILDFLIELQVYTSRELVHENYKSKSLLR
jgi:hypothetical protein